MAFVRGSTGEKQIFLVQTILAAVHVEINNVCRKNIRFSPSIQPNAILNVKYNNNRDRIQRTEQYIKSNERCKFTITGVSSLPS